MYKKLWIGLKDEKTDAMKLTLKKNADKKEVREIEKGYTKKGASEASTQKNITVFSLSKKIL